MLLDTPPRPATAAWPRAEASDSAVEDEEEGLDVDGEGSNEEGSLDEEGSNEYEGGSNEEGSNEDGSNEEGDSNYNEGGSNTRHCTLASASAPRVLRSLTQQGRRGGGGGGAQPPGGGTPPRIVAHPLLALFCERAETLFGPRPRDFRIF